MEQPYLPLWITIILLLSSSLNILSLTKRKQEYSTGPSCDILTWSIAEVNPGTEGVPYLGSVSIINFPFSLQNGCEDEYFGNPFGRRASKSYVHIRIVGFLILHGLSSLSNSMWIATDRGR